MKEGRFLRVGGYISGGVLVVFGIAVIALGAWGFNFTRDHIEREGIVFGPIEDPAVAEHAEQWAGEPVDTGRKALAQAEIMREHTLSDTGGLTYAEMGRYQSADDPSDPAGTNDPEAAAKDENGEPISNSARNMWVTETALATALDMGFMSEMLSIFSVVVGIALLLTGIGLVILAFAVLGACGRLLHPSLRRRNLQRRNCDFIAKASPERPGNTLATRKSSWRFSNRRRELSHADPPRTAPNVH